MIDLDASAVFWLLVAIQLVGLTCAWMARLSEGSRWQTACQHLFVGCLAVVGAAALLSFGLGPGWWLAAGSTLSLMVLTVTCDFSRCTQAAAW